MTKAMRIIACVSIALGMVASDSSSARAAGTAGESAPLLRVHLHRGKVQLAFAEAAFGRDMVVATHSSGASASPNYQLIRWQRESGAIVLRSTPEGREHESRPNWLDASIVVARFPTVACRQEKMAACIDATGLFTDKLKGGWRLAGQGPHVAVESATTYPRNVVIGVARRDTSKRGGWTKWSFVPLPEIPMPKRAYDSRMGYFYPGFLAFEMYADERAASVQPLLQAQPLLRWRLQATGPSKITMYVDPRAPKRWVPWMMEGIESWRPALAAAGFDNAIEAVDAAGIDGWSFDDVNNSAMCWGGGSCGWKIFDPRSGEILQFQMWGAESALKTLLARYVVTMAAVDPRVLADARSDQVAGSLIRRTTTHEMGHALGLRDGRFGPGAYTVEQARSSAWVATHGFTPSVMNYTRFNYLIQPEDGFSPTMTVGSVGPGDVHAIRRGYEFAGTSSKSESDMRAEWLRQQAVDPAYRYGASYIPYLTPSDVYEAVDVDDLVEAARLGVKNLERSLAAIGERRPFAEDDEVAALLTPEQLHDTAIDQWMFMVKPITSLIGGYRPRPGINADMWREDLDMSQVMPVDAQMQRQAMEYLCTNVFPAPPEFLVDGLLQRNANITRAQAEERLHGVRSRMLGDPLLYPIRLQRLVEAQASGQGAFGILDFVRALSSCVVPPAER
ncbi:zinc-dependent metalloprotease [Luteimonas sp. 22616]|uniref:zinc-dependent metalloprotease n=1 Tax=Luteimonas sp. 22616 TaxID=3453951 RepID=UPI003F872F75